MDKAITTVLLIVASVVLAMLLFNTVYPAVSQSGDAIANMAFRQAQHMKTQVTIIDIADELDSTGNLQDTNGNGMFDVFMWVKNTGSVTLGPVESTDVFFGKEGNYVRIPYQANANGSYPYWTWQYETGTSWIPTTTVCITIHYQSPL